jgi:hypothetical protein
MTLSKSSVLYGKTTRYCSGLTNYNFRLKIRMFLYRYLYMCANFETSCCNIGVAGKVQSLRFWVQNGVQMVVDYVTQPYHLPCCNPRYNLPPLPNATKINSTCIPT